MKLNDNIYLVGGGAVGLSPPGDCHVYAIEDAGEIALIDCGMAPRPDRIVENLQNDGLKPENIRYILLTHAHPDHAGAANFFKEHFGAKLVASAYEAKALETGVAEFYGLEGDCANVRQWRDLPAAKTDIITEHGQIIAIGGLRVTALHTPGHSAGSVCYLLEADGKRHLFSGDTIFYKGFISLLSPPFSDYSSYRRSVMDLRGLEISGLFPSHLMWVLEGGQSHIDNAAEKFEDYHLPPIKPFS